MGCSVFWVLLRWLRCTDSTGSEFTIWFEWGIWKLLEMTRGKKVHWDWAGIFRTNAQVRFPRRNDIRMVRERDWELNPRPALTPRFYPSTTTYTHQYSLIYIKTFVILFSGVWCWRGQNLAFEQSEDLQIDYSSYKWTKLDSKSEDCKKKVEDYFRQQGSDSTGREFCDGKIFK